MSEDIPPQQRLDKPFEDILDANLETNMNPDTIQFDDSMMRNEFLTRHNSGNNVDFVLETEHGDLEEKLPDEDYLREMVHHDGGDIFENQPPEAR